MKNIRAYKQADEALLRQAEMLRLSFDAILVWRPGGGIESWNHGAEQLYGYSEAEALGRETHDLLQTTHPLPWSEIEAKLRECGHWEGELHHVAKGGRQVTVSARHQLAVGTDGVERILETNRDITESRKMEKALRESEQCLRALVTASADVMYRMNPDWSEMHQLSGGKFITDTVTTNSAWLQDYIHPDDRAQVMLVIKEAIRTKTNFEMEHRVLRVDGSLGWTFSRALPLLDSRGEISEWFGVATDITARKLAEQALFQAGALQRAIFDSANFSSIATDARGTIQIFNVGAERMLGYTAAEVMNKITPADISDSDEVIERATALSIELGTPIKPGFEALVFKASRGIEDIYELTYVRKDGSRFPAIVSVTALRDAHDAIIGYLLIGTDNTARKQAEEALFKAGALRRAIFNSANFSTIATDANGIIQIFNVGAERMLGYTAAEVMNKITPADISDPSEVVERAQTLSREIGTPIKPGFEALVFKASRGIEDIYALTYVRKDGSRFPAMVSVTALRDAHETILGYLLIGTDNTARKRAEEGLIRNEKLASVGRMAATIAHEINNPLSSAINAIYLVRTDPALPECVNSHLILAEQELGRVAHITKQALGFFREVGSPTDVDLRQVFDSVLDIYAPRLKNKDVEVRRRYQSSTCIHAIDEEIRQVASNIFANSLDALSQGGKLQVRLFGPQSLRGPRRMVRMTIADDGEGIAKENLKRIFEPFFTTKQSIGTGLGLWATSELVKKHEGTMKIKSQLGKGTVVTIWLPLERRDQDRRAA